MDESVAPPFRRFTPSRLMQALCLLGTFGFSAAAYSLHAKEGWPLLTVAAAAMLVPLSIAGFIDALTARVDLLPEKLVVVSNFQRREYARSLFVRATWGKGVPISLEYRDGGWLHLPSFVGGGIGTVNTLRAWLHSGEHAN